MNWFCHPSRFIGVRAFRHHPQLIVSRVCGYISQHLPTVFALLPILLYVIVFVWLKQNSPEIGPDPTKLMIALLKCYESDGFAWLRWIIYVIWIPLGGLIGYLLRYWIERFPLRQGGRLAGIYRSPSLYFAAVAQEFVDERLHSYLDFLTSAQQRNGGAIAEGDFWDLHGIVGDMTTELCALREQQLTTTISVSSLHEKIRELHKQIETAKSSEGKFIRYFVCDDFKETFNLSSYPEEVQHSLISFVCAHRGKNLRLYFINKDDFLRLANDARLDTSRTDCMMLDGRFVFGIKCDWSVGWPQIHKNDEGHVTIFAIHDEYSIAAYQRFFQLLENECLDTYRETSGDVFKMLEARGLNDLWFNHGARKQNNHDSRQSAHV